MVDIRRYLREAAILIIGFAIGVCVAYGVHFYKTDGAMLFVGIFLGFIGAVALVTALNRLWY